MKIVASTKLTRAQRAMTESRKYGQTSNAVFEQAETKPLEGDDKKTLIVVASSDKGLCGGIHSGLTKRVRRMLIEKPNADIVVLGEKCKAQLSRLCWYRKGHPYVCRCPGDCRPNFPSPNRLWIHPDCLQQVHQCNQLRGYPN
jgi:hypothetical protein